MNPKRHLLRVLSLLSIAISAFALVSPSAFCAPASLEGTIALVESMEQSIQDLTVTYQYMPFENEEEYRAKNLPPWEITMRVRIVGGEYCESTEQWRYATKGGEVVLDDHTLDSSDGARGYRIFHPLGQYHIMDPAQVKDRSYVEFFKKGTIFLFGPAARLSAALRQESTRIVEEAESRQKVLLACPNQDDYYFPQYAITFDLSAGLRILKIEGWFDLEKGPVMAT